MTSKTFAQQAGFILNVTRLKLTEQAAEDQDDNYRDMVWLLRNDDESSCPYFKSECGTVGNICFWLEHLEIIQDEAPTVITMPYPPIPVLLRPQPPAPAVPTENVYSVLQSQAISTFMGMFRAAAAHREGKASDLDFKYGICDNISHFAGAAGVPRPSTMIEVKENLIRLTPSYSGNYTYPVPGVNGRDAHKSFNDHYDKWKDEYGLNRLNQLAEMIDIIKSEKWDDSLANRQTPAKRNGLEIGDLVSYKRNNSTSMWVFRYDDESTSPSFHRLGDIEDRSDLDLAYVTKVTHSSNERPVAEFLNEINEKLALKITLAAQIAELQKQLNNVDSEVALLDHDLAQQHKVKRIQ